MKKIILGVTGSISAYKAADIANKLKRNYIVQVVMTESASKFITPLTFQNLTNNKVLTHIFDEEDKVTHVDLIKECDLLLIAPATANIIAKINYGLADDLLSTMAVVSTHNKMIIAPAMNTNMYNNPITQNNISNLKNLGVKFINPRESLLACGDYGVGALEEVDKIVKFVEKELNNDIN